MALGKRHAPHPRVIATASALHATRSAFRPGNHYLAKIFFSDRPCVADSQWASLDWLNGASDLDDSPATLAKAIGISGVDVLTDPIVTFWTLCRLREILRRNLKLLMGSEGFNVVAAHAHIAAETSWKTP